VVRIPGLRLDKDVILVADGILLAIAAQRVKLAQLLLVLGPIALAREPAALRMHHENIGIVRIATVVALGVIPDLGAGVRRLGYRGPLREPAPCPVAGPDGLPVLDVESAGDAAAGVDLSDVRARRGSAAVGSRLRARQSDIDLGR